MTKPLILFIDDVCPEPYDTETLKTRAQGGTESTVTRIADGLAILNIADVYVKQHCRKESFQTTGAFYCHSTYGCNPTYVITLRSIPAFLKAKELYPNAKHYLWLHDMPGDYQFPFIQSLIETKPTIIGVSEYHKQNIIECWRSQHYAGQFPITAIYNPISPDIGVHSSHTIDNNKLIWMSSPHKGLKEALFIFNNLLHFNKEFKFHVYNPGYLPIESVNNINVVVKGKASQLEMFQDLATSLCLFYPNVVFPETFGLVMAEANALRVPVLTSNLGAAREILDRPEQEIVNCYDPKAVIDTVMRWHNGERPIVRGRKEFRLSNVLLRWRSLFNL